MFSMTKMVLAAALVLGSGFAALANDRDGEEGGFVMPGSMDGVNPAFHRDWFPDHAAQTRKVGKILIDSATRDKASEAYGLVNSHTKPAAASPKEDNYGSEAGKN